MLTNAACIVQKYNHTIIYTGSYHAKDYLVNIDVKRKALTVFKYTFCNIRNVCATFYQLNAS